MTTSRRIVWATVLALGASVGLFSVRRPLRPATARYRLARIDRGRILTGVMASGVVAAPVDTGQRVRQVQVKVASADAALVAVGEAATLQVETDPAGLGATVSGLRPVASAADVGAPTVLIDVDDRSRKLRPGMTATVWIEVARREHVLRLPLAALAFAPLGMELGTPATRHEGRIFVLDHGRPRPVRVTIGLADGQHVELVAGPLREGDAVIVEEFGAVVRPRPQMHSSGGDEGAGS